MPDIDALLERQRLLARILNRDADPDADPDPVPVTATSVADTGADREALSDSPSLADEHSALLPERPAAQADGERSVAVAGNNSGIISTGDGAKNTLHQ
ncbi:hypothetical protein OH805_05265 [Streptomyces sp. NBC_00879]|uniref:hypothetical protein n=1 Tax=Streptomyces sp. NBC_00879 TaxID=2975855 RepID=UPI003864B203|nr:hypothetical protein OH805_05265 [Streptomyces sp. NBC_00879]